MKKNTRILLSILSALSGNVFAQEFDSANALPVALVSSVQPANELSADDSNSVLQSSNESVPATEEDVAAVAESPDIEQNPPTDSLLQIGFVPDSVPPVEPNDEKIYEEPPVSASLNVEREGSASTVKEKKKGGVLDGLYPVDPDEAIAKGRFYGGTSLSLIQGNTDKDALNILIGDVYDAYGYTFTVEAFGGYFIRDAMALGMRVGYSRTWFDVDFALLEDLLDMAEHRKYVSNGFFIQPVLKNYLKVLDSRNFYFFNETSISVEYSYGISQSDDGEDLSKSRNNSWTIKAGINPGICIMVLNRFAFETSVGLLGLSSSVMEVEENNETRSQFVYNIVNFTINLLALDFSLVYFF